MSLILSEEIKSKVVQDIKTIEGIKCDICGTIIPTSQLGKDAPKYYEVTTGHYDWGNDSCESRIERDICPDCIVSFVSDYLKKATGSEYIDIETRYARKREIGVNVY